MIAPLSFLPSEVICQVTEWYSQAYMSGVVGVWYLLKRFPAYADQTILIQKCTSEQQTHTEAHPYKPIQKCHNAN